MAAVFQSIVYVQLRRRRISIRVLSWAGGDSRWEGVPDIQIVRDGKGRESAIPIEAQPPGSTVASRMCRLLSHPRVFVDSSSELAHAMRLFVKMAGLKRSAGKPIFIMQVGEVLEGGLTQLEQTALRDVALSCGAGKVLVLESELEMSPPEFLALAKGKRELSRAGAT